MEYTEYAWKGTNVNKCAQKQTTKNQKKNLRILKGKGVPLDRPFAYPLKYAYPRLKTPALQDRLNPVP